MFLDVLMMNERLVEENEWLRNTRVGAAGDVDGDFAGEGANTDVLDEHVSNAAPESYEIDKLDLLEGFATHPEMGGRRRRARAVVLMENPGVGATRKRTLFDDAARKLGSGATRPVPGRCARRPDARAAFVRTLWYAWRLFCFAPSRVRHVGRGEDLAHPRPRRVRDARRGERRPPRSGPCPCS